MALAYVENWDVNTPQGSESRSLGDDRIREMKRGLTERLGTLMNFPEGNPLELKDGSVGGSTLQDNSITTAKIVDGAVTNAKLAALSVSLDKLTAALKQVVPSMTIFETTAGASLNHNGADVLLAAGNNLSSWVFANVPGLVMGAAPNVVTPLPGKRPSIVVLDVVSASLGALISSSTTADNIGWLNWNVVPSQFADSTLTVYASWGGTGAGITVTADTKFRFGIFNLLDPSF